MSIKRKIYLLILSLVTAPLFSSCSKDSIVQKDGLLYGEIVGDLLRTNYSNKYDSWDLKGMSIVLYYEDGSTERIDSTDKDVHYTFLPESPTGLEVGNTSFTMTSGYYVDYKGNKHDIKPRTFENIRIKYSGRNTEPTVKNKIFGYIALGFLILLVPFLIIYLSVIFYRKKKGIKRKKRAHTHTCNI